MQFTSLGFIVFLLVSTIVYYRIPKSKQWYILLGSSYLFYATFSLKGFIYIIASTLVSYFVTVKMQQIQDSGTEQLQQITDKEQRKSIKQMVTKQKKRYLTLGLVFCFGILAVLKYANYTLVTCTQLLSVFKIHLAYHPMSLFVPIGISFYTFSIAGYIIDIYYNKYRAQTSLAQYALFVSWFPALIQGPINRNNQLRAEFFEKEHNFSLPNIEFALQRILLGFLKKLLIADYSGQLVSYVFDNYQHMANYMIALGLFFYAIQLYADFAGGMDIALGISQVFGIRLSENFRQPYFARSIADFWRRWHITLGAWMKDYIFYPFSLSKPMMAITKKLAPKNKYLARVIPMSLGNILVFIIVGIWHGAEGHYVVYGLFNGLIIAFSILMQPWYDKWLAFFHINAKSKPWIVVQIIRTFILINLGNLFDNVHSMQQSIGMTKRLFSANIPGLITNFSNASLESYTFPIIFVFTSLWFIMSICKENKIDVQQKIAALPLPVRWALYLFLIYATPFFQSDITGGFMYAQF